MKKFIILLLLLIAMPAHAVILVYKMTTTFNPLVITTASNPSIATVSKTTLLTFLVFDVNVNSRAVIIPRNATNNVFSTTLLPRVNGIQRLNSIEQPVIVQNAGSPVAIVSGILNGHRFQTRIGGSDLNSSVSIGTNSEANSIRPFRVRNQTTTNMMLFIDIIEANSIMLSAQLIGKVNRFVVQNGNSIIVASALKGNAEIFDLTGRIAGFGTASATLSTTYTSAARRRGLSVSQTATLIQSDLRKNNFVITSSFP